jgi:hypothetical protein
MGCYLEEYRAGVGTWAGRVSWRSAAGQAGGNNYRGTMRRSGK